MFENSETDTYASDVPLSRPPPRFLTPHPSTFKNYSCCPWSKSVIAIDAETEKTVLCPVTCKRWGCSYCAPRKIRRLAFLTNGAQPNRWIRLGVDPAKYESPKAAWEHTAPLLPECIRSLRKNLGPIEYLRVCELHKSGFPHYHALLRSGFIPQKMLSSTWKTLADAPVVWISKIDKSFSSFRYLTKYLTKLHRIEWTDRHVSYSRNFFRPEDTEKITFQKKEVTEKSDTHPWKWLCDHYPGEEIAMECDGTFTLPHSPDWQRDDVPMSAFDFTTVVPPESGAPSRQNQTNLPGMLDSDSPDYF